MTYWLGIDLGTTHTAAAVCRPAAYELETQVVPLGSRSLAAPSVLFLSEDGSVTLGEAAQRRGLAEPDRVVREFKGRIGDEIPLLVGGSPHLAHDLAARLVRWVWQVVVDQEGELPQGVALTCPTSWGPYKTRLFEQAVWDAGIGDVALLSESEAAAVSYDTGEQVEAGGRLALYDLGGGTFNAAVVRKDSPARFTVLGSPEGIDGLGGVNFDEAIFEHVCAAAGVTPAEIDPEDPGIVLQVAHLRRACAEAKEALSLDTDTIIPVALGGIRQRVRLTRAEFEEMIRPDLARTIEALHRALDSASVDSAQLDAIVLAGGSSRIPLVSQLISAEFGQAPAIGTGPETAMAVGAARFLAPDTSWPEEAADTAFELPPVPPVPPERPQIRTMLAADDSAAEPVRRRSRKAMVSAAAIVLLLVAGGLTALGAPKLSDLLTHSPVPHGVTATPTSGPSAGLDATPRSTAGPRPGSTTGGPVAAANSSGPAGGKVGSSGKTSSNGKTSSALSAASPAHSTSGTSSGHNGSPTVSPSPTISARIISPPSSPPPASPPPSSPPPSSPTPTPTGT